MSNVYRWVQQGCYTLSFWNVKSALDQPLGLGGLWLAPCRCREVQDNNPEEGLL